MKKCCTKKPPFKDFVKRFSRDFRESPEISDYNDYEAITLISEKRIVILMSK